MGLWTWMDRMTSFRGRTLVLAMAVAVTSTPAAWARVGVASVVEGEPLGKPPTTTERVLKIGNDMESNERITTKSNDRVHIVFLDGSSLTVGPNSVLVVDKFVYDPAKRTGELALSAPVGVFRFVGGAISKTSE